MAFVMILVIIFKTLMFGEPVAGYPSTMCVMFFIGGLQLFSIGILGQYMSKTYLETKKRPIYIIKEENVDIGQLKMEFKKNSKTCVNKGNQV